MSGFDIRVLSPKQMLLFLAVYALANPAICFAKDFKALSMFVTPAYTAMQYGVLCARDNPWFLSDTSGPRGTIYHYAEHVKDEAIESLTHEEAISVLKAAADAAREVTRKKIRELVVPNDNAVTVTAVRSWCDTEGKEFILSFIEHHDREHAAVVEMLKRSKQ